MSSKIQGYSVPKAPEQNKSDKYKKISQTKALNEDFQIKSSLSVNPELENQA
jgi:hypothetical protein